MFKKIFLLVLLVGCQPAEGLTPVGSHAGNEISTFSYKNHDYIQFDCGVGQNRVRAIVHDPDCPCKAAVKLDQWMSQ